MISDLIWYDAPMPGRLHREPKPTSLYNILINDNDNRPGYLCSDCDINCK